MKIKKEQIIKTDELFNKNSKQSITLDDLFKDYKKEQHIEEFDWGKSEGREIL